MKFAQQLLLYISITAVLFLAFGLYKPWVMLWWEDVQNRRKVIKLYGAIATVAFVLYCVLFFI